MRDEVRSLITELESALKGSPELSKRVLQFLGWEWERMGCPGGGLWKTPDTEYQCGPLPRVTENVEAARTLVPEGLFVSAQEDLSGRWKVALYDHPLKSNDDYCDPKVIAVTETLPLSLCTAALKTLLPAPASL